MVEQNGDKERRSRKWLLAIASLTLATLASAVLQVVVFALAWKGLLTGEPLRAMVMGVLYWWLFVDMAVLSGYGVANVVEKWAPK